MKSRVEIAKENLMQKQLNQGRLQAFWALFVGCMLTTLLIDVRFTDPLNRPKMLFISSILLLVFILTFKHRYQLIHRATFLPFLLYSLIILVYIVRSFLGPNSFYMALIGSRGRAIGAIFYICLAAISMLILIQYEKRTSSRVIYAFSILVIIEITYGVIQIQGNDFIQWNNSYSPIITTFGNPNFASAFNGVGSLVLLWVSFQQRKVWSISILSLIYSLLGLYLIIKSSSSQGLFAFLAGVMILLICKAVSTSKFLGATMLFGTATSTFFVIIGTLNRGPLADFVYQTSINARGDYWRVAIEIFKDHALFGIGLDNFGSYFGTYRDISQVQGRGYATLSDNAHNVFLQQLSTGGLLIFIPTIVLFSFIAVRALILLARSEFNIKNPNVLLVALWVSLQPISFVSIDNIGLTIWIWVFGAIIVAASYSNSDGELVQVKPRSRKSIISTQLLLVVMYSIFFLKIIFPIFNSEINLKASYEKLYTEQSQELVGDEIEKLAKLNPGDESVISQLSSIASQKSSPNVVLKIVDYGLKINPRSLDLLRFKATAFDDLSNFKEAARTRELIREFDPLHLNNIALLAQNYVWLNELSKAKKLAQIMNSISPNNEFQVAVEYLIESGTTQVSQD